MGKILITIILNHIAISPTYLIINLPVKFGYFEGDKNDVERLSRNGNHCCKHEEENIEVRVENAADVEVKPFTYLSLYYVTIG